MRRRKGESIVKNRKKPTFDGIIFDSSLELFMYKLLKNNNLDFNYEVESYVLSEAFDFSNNSYERLTSGRGEFKDRGLNKMRPITYRPDFIVGDEDFIIETKGWANDVFPMRWKLFKKKLMDEGKKSILMKPQNRKECEECLKIILKFYESRR